MQIITFQEMLKRFIHFWENQGCVFHQGYDLETGAGTFNPTTFLRALGPEPYRAFYVEPCRRPSDGRYGTNPNRIQHYFQGQVIMKPSPPNILELCLGSLEAIGFDLSQHDMRFVHDDWESPTLGASGLGWEVWMDGMEVTQFTYFQTLGGFSLKPVTAEITYGLERLALYLQKVNSIFDLQYNEELTYGDIYFNNEVQWSHYNFEQADSAMWFRHFEDYEQEAQKMIAAELPLPAYDFVAKASHAFNLLDARGVISVTERTGYIARIRELARQIAESYIDSRKKLNYPLLNRFQTNDQPIQPHQLAPIAPALLQATANQKDDFLLEIGSEELPATFIPIGLENLAKGFKRLLEKEDIAYASIRTEGTPRRLMVLIEGVSLARAPQISEKKGPPLAQIFDAAGHATAAGEGFFRSIGKGPMTRSELDSKRDPTLEVRSIKGIDYLFAHSTQPGKSTAEILAEKIPDLILSLEFPKKMRWGNLDITYPRPLRWILALLGAEVVPFIVGDLLSDRLSYGHRQLAPAAFPIGHPKEYIETLLQHKVMVEVGRRKEEISRGLDALEASTHGKVLAREKVLSAVMHLVEWPTVTAASFDEAFLKIPKEVLISEMVEHQKYFPMGEEGDGDGLKNLFLITANVPPTDAICEGNQKVLSARLSDGAFLYEQGLKQPLESYNEKLKLVMFQKELGSVYAKMRRVEKIALHLQLQLHISTPEMVQRAAYLSKADLASEMVYEFPDLQGTIGRLLALAQGEAKDVAFAIEEQWMPRGEKAPLPETETGMIISLADKIDNIVGCFAVGLKPSSSSDPYALRRQTLGIIKMAIREQKALPLRGCMEVAFNALPLHLQKEKAALLDEIEAFIVNRIKTVFVEYGFLRDEIEAALTSGCSDIYDAFCKVRALHEFREKSPQFAPLCEVYKRAKGQLGGYAPTAFSSALLLEPAEKQLDRDLNAMEEPFSQAIATRNYDQAYQLIAQLQPALASLFEQVKILDDDLALRDNRLSLLHRVLALFALLIDFSKIQTQA